MFVNTQKYVISVNRFNVMLEKSQNYMMSTCVNSRWGTSDLSRNRLGWDVFLTLVHDPHFFVKAETLLSFFFFADLGASGLRALHPDIASRQSHERRRKTAHEIFQSASQLKILEQNDQRCLSATLAVNVMLSLRLESVSELPFGEAVKLAPKPFFDFILRVFFVFREKTSAVCWRCK